MLPKLGDRQRLGNKKLQTPVTSATVFPFTVPQTQFNFIKDGSLVFHAQFCTVGGRGHFACPLKSEFLTAAIISEVSRRRYCFRPEDAASKSLRVIYVYFYQTAKVYCSEHSNVLSEVFEQEYKER